MNATLTTDSFITWAWIIAVPGGMLLLIWVAVLPWIAERFL